MSLPSMLRRLGVCFVAGVPDSVLNPMISGFDTENGLQHCIAACEGSAVSMAAGHSLVSGHPACAYMQNSGLPNALNPLLSMFTEEIYDIPLILVVGWRGEPGKKDEPQHSVIGRYTQDMLVWLGIDPVYVDGPEALVASETSLATAVAAGRPTALLVSRGAFSGNDASLTLPSKHPDLPRETVMSMVLDSLPSSSLVFSGIGYTGREIMHLRAVGKIGDLANFPCVGGMGFASHIALGASFAHPDRPVYCLDGDGSFLMHGLGNAAIRNVAGPFRHIVFNNGCHDSVGGFETCNPSADLPKIAMAIGYNSAERVTSAQGLNDALDRLRKTNGPAFLDIACGRNTLKNLPRPDKLLTHIKHDFLSTHDCLYDHA